MASTDREALVALFRSTGGAGWEQRRNWDTDADLATWYGVKVNDQGRVVKLHLWRNNLQGAIPAQLGALNKLTWLALSGNQLSGHIPEELGALSKLGVLELQNNELTGHMPPELGNLSTLRKLFIYENQLSGPIPKELGSLSKLKKLCLYINKLTGPIPKQLGALTKLQILCLHGNALTGPIPPELGNLASLQILYLQHNLLSGSIPPELGDLRELQELWLNQNQLTGPIPPELGNLAALEMLFFWGNGLTDPIPAELGNLAALKVLSLSGNQLRGSIPPKLGNLGALETLALGGNELTGSIPKELGNLGALRNLELGNNTERTHSIWRRGKKLTGGPRMFEGLDSWRARMRLKQKTKPQTLTGDKKEEDTPVPSAPSPPVLLPQQQGTGEGDEQQEGAQVPTVSTPPVLLTQQQEEGEGDEYEEDAPARLDSLNEEEEMDAESASSPERASLSPGKAEEVDRSFRAQLSSSAGLDSLIRENPEAMEDIQRVLEATVAGGVYPSDQLSGMEERRKLGTLVTMSTALGEVALRHTEDMDVQRKEQALPPFWNAYYKAVRLGLCKAYLAASVIDSGSVATSKTGVMGKAGTALKLSSAVPVVGGLAGLAGKALQTGDHYLQTRRLAKITAMAADAVECCSLARRLALQLADRLRNDGSATADESDQVCVDTTAGAKGGSGSGRGGDIPDSMTDEDVFEYVLEEVASYESNDHGGKRLGKQHLRMLLKAIQRGCLDGSNCAEEKIEILLLEILPKAGVRPTETSSTPKEVIVRPPTVVAAAQDRESPSMADFAAMQAALEELQAAKDKQQQELEEQQAKIEAVESRNKQLRDKVAAMEKRVPDGDCEPSDMVTAGGGQVLQRKLEVKEDLDSFWERKEKAASAGDQGTLTPAEHHAETRDTRARVDEVENRVDFMGAQLAALAQRQAGKKGGFSQRGRHHH